MLGVYREDGPGRLLEVLETVPDPRSAHGLRQRWGLSWRYQFVRCCAGRAVYTPSHSGVESIQS